MKPPVEAPTSSALRPSTSSSSASSAFASLTPPRETYGGGPSTSSSTSASTSWPGFSARRRPAPRWTSPGDHGRGRARARLEQSAFRQQGVQAHAGHGQNGTGRRSSSAARAPMRGCDASRPRRFLSCCSRCPRAPPRSPAAAARLRGPDRLDLARRAADLRRAHRPRPRQRVVRVSGRDDGRRRRAADRPRGHAGSTRPPRRRSATCRSGASRTPRSCASARGTTTGRRT